MCFYCAYVCWSCCGCCNSQANVSCWGPEGADVHQGSNLHVWQKVFAPEVSVSACAGMLWISGTASLLLMFRPDGSLARTLSCEGVCHGCVIGSFGYYPHQQCAWLGNSKSSTRQFFSLRSSSLSQARQSKCALCFPIATSRVSQDLSFLCRSS